MVPPEIVAFPYCPTKTPAPTRADVIVTLPLMLTVPPTLVNPTSTPWYVPEMVPPEMSAVPPATSTPLYVVPLTSPSVIRKTAPSPAYTPWYPLMVPPAISTVLSSVFRTAPTPQPPVVALFCTVPLLIFSVPPRTQIGALEPLKVPERICVPPSKLMLPLCIVMGVVLPKSTSISRVTVAGVLSVLFSDA